MANAQIGVLNLGIYGGFNLNSPPISSFSAHKFSISKCPNSSTTPNCSTVRKKLIFVGRKPEFSRVAGFPSRFSVYVEKSWNFDGRGAKYSTVRALGNEGVDAHSSSIQIVEKDLKFSPTFQDYLKVMESVRTDRSNNPCEDIDIVAPKKRSVGRGDSHRVWEKADSRGRKLSQRRREKDSVDRNKGSVARRDDGWGLVERILEKKTSSKGGNQSKDVKNSFGKELGGTRDNVDSEEKERAGSIKLKEQDRREDRKVDRSLIHGQSEDPLERSRRDRSSVVKRSGSSYEKVYVKKVDHVNDGRASIGTNEMKRNKGNELHNINLESFNDSTNFTDSETFVRGNTDRKLDVIKTPSRNGTFNRVNISKKINGNAVSEDEREDRMFSRIEWRKTEGNLSGSERAIIEKEGGKQSIGQRLYRFKVDNGKTDKIGFGAIEVRGRSVKSNAQSDMVENQEVDYEDRAAFKTFEVFTDVRNRPRVLRMELEERIQKLAKQLNATDVNMPEWQFSKMIHGAKIKFTEHSILRIVQILGAMGNWKRALQIVQWLQSRERFKSYKSRYIYTTVLDVLGKAKRPTEALNVFYAMREELSSYPDLAAYHCIAVTLGQAGLMKDLFDVIDCMRAPPEKKFKLGVLQKWDPRLEPDLVIYHAVLNACVQQKQWEGALWVLQQLKQQNIRPTNTTYGLIMEVMLASGKHNLVHEVFRKVEKTSIPSALNYKVLVNTLWREGKTDEAVLAVKDMERRGIVGSASLYYDLARCLCSAGRCQEALLQVDKICKVAKKPLVVTYTGMIQACLDSGSIENAAYIFDEMHRFCAPNIITCNIMLKSYIKHGMVKEAKDLFQKILDGSHQSKTENERDQKAIPDKFTFNTMMDACAATNHWDYFEYTYQQMLHQGYHFDARRHLRLVLDAFRAGKRGVIEATWDHLTHFRRDPPYPVIQARFCIKLQEEDTLAAISCIEALSESDAQAFLAKSFLNLLEANGRRFNKDFIRRLTHELNNRVDERNWQSPVYQSILNACRRFTEITNDVSIRR